MADLANRTDRVLERHVPQHDLRVLEHAQHHGGRADLDERRVLAHVRVADDDVQPAIALGIGVRFVPGVDDRAAARRRRRHPFPDVLGPLRDRVDRPPGRLQHLARAGEDLAGDEERDQDLGVVGEVVPPAGQVVLVAPVAVAGRVGVVLEQVDRAPDALFTKALLGRHEELLEDPFPGLVVDDEVVEGVALGRGVLGMRSDVEVETGAVLQEDVGAAAPGDDAPEQVPSDLIRAQTSLATQRTGHPVFVLEAEDATLHEGNISLAPPCVAACAPVDQPAAR